MQLNTFFKNATLSVLLTMSLIVSGCNAERSQAKKLANEFMRSYLSDDTFSNRHFGKLDSTMTITDSVVTQLRERAESSGLFKTGIPYPDKAVPSTLYYISVDYTDCRQEERHLTFYFTRQLDDIVAVKGY